MRGRDCPLQPAVTGREHRADVRAARTRQPGSFEHQYRTDLTEAHSREHRLLRSGIVTEAGVCQDSPGAAHFRVPGRSSCDTAKRQGYPSLPRATARPPQCSTGPQARRIVCGLLLQDCQRRVYGRSCRPDGCLNRIHRDTFRHMARVACVGGQGFIGMQRSMTLRTTRRLHTNSVRIMATCAKQFSFRLSEACRLQQTVAGVVNLETVRLRGAGAVEVHLVIR